MLIDLKIENKSERGIQNRLLKGIAAQGFTQAIQVFIRLAEVPLLLSFWGTQLYGEWLMLSAIPVYLSISDCGFSTAACRELTMKGGSGDRYSVRAVFQSTWLLLITVSLATCLLAFCFVETVPLENWLGFSDMKGPQIKIVLILLVMHVLVSFQGDLLNGGFWVTGRYSIGMYHIAITQLIEFSGLSIAVAMGGRPVHAACGFLIGRILGTGLMWLGQHMATPWLKHGVSYASITEIKRLTAPALGTVTFSLGNALNSQGMRLIVGLTLGPSAVALFVPMRTLSRIVMQPTNIINRLIEPELALAYGTGNHALFKRIFARSCQLALWGCLGVCFFVGPGAYWIFPEWTDSMVSMHWPTYLVLLSVVVINSIWYTALMAPYSINLHGRIAYFYVLVYGFAAVCFGYIWSERFGLAGAALALLLAEAVMAAVVIHNSLRMLSIGATQWGKTILQPPFDIFGQASVIMRKLISDASGWIARNEILRK